MASIYLHIPFCKQACHYCDFHFSTSVQRIDDMVEAMLIEMRERANYLSGQSISSIYFGGGTPSLLKAHQLNRLLEHMQSYFHVESGAEVTLEANPDDLSRAKIQDLFGAGINRLSIGIQSFDDNQLQRMNRAHTAKEAEFAVKCAQDTGIENITADLIFALPDLSIEAWSGDVRRVLDMGVQHLSAYGLTIEPKTVFHKWSSTGRIQEANAGTFESHFRATPVICAEYGLEHYEVSNFGQPQFYSKHNSAYWKGTHYLGIGPSAHSFDGQSRQWNVSNNPQYIHQVMARMTHWEREAIEPIAACNEYLMTGLRTQWGIDLKYLTTKTEWAFGAQQLEQLQNYLDLGLAYRNGDAVSLTIDGLLQVDTLTSALFVENEPH